MRSISSTQGLTSSTSTRRAALRLAEAPAEGEARHVVEQRLEHDESDSVGRALDPAERRPAAREHRRARAGPPRARPRPATSIGESRRRSARGDVRLRASRARQPHLAARRMRGIRGRFVEGQVKIPADRARKRPVLVTGERPGVPRLRGSGGPHPWLRTAFRRLGGRPHPGRPRRRQARGVPPLFRRVVPARLRVSPCASSRTGPTRKRSRGAACGGPSRR